MLGLASLYLQLVEIPATSIICRKIPVFVRALYKHVRRKTSSCGANPRINTALRLCPRNLVPTNNCLPRLRVFCRCFVSSPAVSAATPPPTWHSFLGAAHKLAFHHPVTDVAPWLLWGEHPPPFVHTTIFAFAFLQFGFFEGSTVPEGGRRGTRGRRDGV